jgi:hypothetical protein
MLPMPAEKQATQYDSLPAAKPGIPAAQIRQDYGEPHLNCDDNRLWIYGWSVGHGGTWGVLLGAGTATSRVYHSFHVVFLRLDAEQNLARVEALPPVNEVTDNSPSAPMCDDGGTCIRPSWERSPVARDASWLCDPAYPCGDWYLGSSSVVESDGRPLQCVWARPAWSCPNSWTCPGVTPH